MTDVLTYYWSRVPGKFVRKETGEPWVGENGFVPEFKGIVREWYETLTEVTIDLCNALHKQSTCPDLEGPAEIKASPDAHVIYQCSILYQPLETGGGRISHMDISSVKGLSSDEVVVYFKGQAGMIKILDVNIL